MLTRRTLALSLLAAPAAWLAPAAFAAQRLAYSPAAFDAAQGAGKPILVVVHATWCPTCRAQAPILSQLESEPNYAGLVVFHVDFDAQKDALKRFGVRLQSTLIAFKGRAETGRSVGDTDPGSIAALFAKTL